MKGAMCFLNVLPPNPTQTAWGPGYWEIPSPAQLPEDRQVPGACLAPSDPPPMPLP